MNVWGEANLQYLKNCDEANWTGGRYLSGDPSQWSKGMDPKKYGMVEKESTSMK